MFESQHYEKVLFSFNKCQKFAEIAQEQATLESKKVKSTEKCAIEFKDYELRYREDTQLVLKGVNVKINHGEKVGIVGRTGAGKSTLALAICRIIEAAGGSIFMDGKDISTIPLKELRKMITIIPQDPTLFSGTLRFNLDPFNEHSDEEINELVKAAALESFVNRDEKGML